MELLIWSVVPGVNELEAITVLRSLPMTRTTAVVLVSVRALLTSASLDLLLLTSTAMMDPRIMVIGNRTRCLPKKWETGSICLNSE